MLLRLLFISLISLAAPFALSHDTWVQPNAHVLRTGEVAYIDLMLGNHGNEHRDFRLASKVSLDRCKLELCDPSGKSHDLKPAAADLGMAPKEGFWSARYVTKEDGLHTILHSTEGAHGTIRTIKSAKSYFIAGAVASAVKQGSFSEPIGYDLEVVPLTNPALASAGSEIKVRVDFKKRPLKDARVSFIPRGQVLAAGFDDQFERRTDAHGAASFTPSEGNYLLIVVHHLDPEAKGEGFDKTQYSATLALCVPQLPMSTKE